MAWEHSALGIFLSKVRGSSQFPAADYPGTITPAADRLREKNSETIAAAIRNST
jgi:hypothetical protein